METKGKANDPKSWDDLVFEDRNVDYGAYAVRKSYTGNLTSGFLLSVSFGGLLFIVPMVMSLLDDDSGKDSVIPVTPTVNDTLVFTQVQVILPPPPPPGPSHPHVTPPTEPPVVNAPPVVTTDAPDDATITANVDIPPATPTVPDGVPGGVEGGTGTDPSVTDVVPSVDINQPYLAPQVAASYTGGMEAMYNFIRRKINYPASARRMGLEGTVYVSFVIGRDGKVTKVEVIRGLSPDCDKEAARVIALLPGWNPGRQNDVPVMVRMTLPIKFALDK
ncbi:energy transducer TonB [Parachryseolinea silvisoli]|jgi:protein TonB|uniref:energy transducer TonB n=1 Tax=Parachryseolinea silvisoli TaxID=2873601 RepID=UPI002265F1E2|nr:energy transducer TonB [Parachryseolinea silvisoli]MCD9017366.1 energy transducer TonB [Parachryseolinea silvisoli]